MLSLLLPPPAPVILIALLGHLPTFVSHRNRWLASKRKVPVDCGLDVVARLNEVWKEEVGETEGQGETKSLSLLVKQEILSLCSTHC